MEGCHNLSQGHQSEGEERRLCVNMMQLQTSHSDKRCYDSNRPIQHNGCPGQPYSNVHVYNCKLPMLWQTSPTSPSPNLSSHLTFPKPRPRPLSLSTIPSPPPQTSPFHFSFPNPPQTSLYHSLPKPLSTTPSPPLSLPKPVRTVVRM